MFLYFYIFLFFLMLLSFFNPNPLKSFLFFILGYLVISFVLSYGMYFWFCYFISMVFLSGIFVLLVYFCGISSLNTFNKFSTLSLIGFLFINFDVFYLDSFNFYFMSSIYLWFYIFFMFILVSILFFFFLFVSYFLSNGYSLRSL